MSDSGRPPSDRQDGVVRERFDRYLRQVVTTLQDRDDVLGVVGMGSTAARDRVDEWSDHDLAIVVADGAQERYRDPFRWLPEAERIALVVREWHDGVRVLYDDGHLIEFGVATPEELSSWHVDANAVCFDRGGVADAVARAAGKPLPHGRPDAATALAVLLVCVIVGVGRTRRGELINANAVLRGEAVDAFVTAVTAARRPEPGGQPDLLDHSRRFEVRHPAIAARLIASLAQDLEECARELLDLAEEVFGDALPPRGVAAVRGRLGWQHPDRPSR